MNARGLRLLEQYTRQEAEDAFAALVRDYLDLVYSAALRAARSAQLAEEVAQSVFTDLARQAHKMKPDTLLSAWLYRVTRRTAIDVVRRESRRQRREQVAVEQAGQHSPASSEWTHAEPLLDEAMDALPEADRNSVLLRLPAQDLPLRVGLPNTCSRGPGPSPTRADGCASLRSKLTPNSPKLA